jgi:hypothetical protein
VLPGHLAPGLMSGPGVLAPLVVALALVVVAVRLVRRWSAAPDWGRPHRVALGSGALLGHSLLWGATQPATATDRAVVGVLLVITAGALVALAREGAARPDRVAKGVHGRR